MHKAAQTAVGGCRLIYRIKRTNGLLYKSHLLFKMQKTVHSKWLIYLESKCATNT